MPRSNSNRRPQKTHIFPCISVLQPPRFNSLEVCYALRSSVTEITMFVKKLNACQISWLKKLIAQPLIYHPTVCLIFVHDSENKAVHGKKFCFWSNFPLILAVFFFEWWILEQKFDSSEFFAVKTNHLKSTAFESKQCLFLSARSRTLCIFCTHIHMTDSRLPYVIRQSTPGSQVHSLALCIFISQSDCSKLKKEKRKLKKWE